MELESRRYLNRKKYRNRPLDIFEVHQVRNRDPDSNNPLTEREFLERYRMTRATFDRLHQLIENHPVFGLDHHEGTTRNLQKGSNLQSQKVSETKQDLCSAPYPLCESERGAGIAV